MPFKWNTSLVSGNLRSLQIQTLVAPIGPQSAQITLDRVHHALAQNLTLEHLSLSFHAIHPSLLPLDTLKLPVLRSLHLTGNLVICKLLEAISAPALETIVLNMDYEGLDTTLIQFLVRSQHPPVHTLSIGYDNTGGVFGMAMHYPQHMDNEPGPWQFLSALPQLRTLKIGRTNLDLLLDALKSRDGSWPVPQLEHLALRGCNSTMGEAESPKFFTVINERNPPQNGEPPLPTSLTLPPQFNPWFIPPGHLPPPGFMGNITPPTPPSPILPSAPPVGAAPSTNGNHFERLRILEMHDCLTLGDNVVKLLRTRIDEVRYTRPYRYGCCGPSMTHMID